MSWEGALSVDAAAMDRLVLAFAQCRELGVEIPALMPLDTPAHQRAAAWYLSRLVQRVRDGLA